MIQNLDELERLMKILRVNGANLFKWNGLEVCLNELPIQTASLSNQEDVLQFPSQAELDKAVGLPVGDLDDPFIDYSVESPILNEDSKG